jgi:hypothetical protein
MLIIHSGEVTMWFLRPKERKRQLEVSCNILELVRRLVIEFVS